MSRWSEETYHGQAQWLCKCTAEHGNVRLESTERCTECEEKRPDRPEEELARLRILVAGIREDVAQYEVTFDRPGRFADAVRFAIRKFDGVE